MQIHGATNVTAGATIHSKPNVVGTTAKAVKTEQSLPNDQVTLSQGAKQMSVSKEPAINTVDYKQVESEINSGNYTVIGTALSGHLVELFVE